MTDHAAEVASAIVLAAAGSGAAALSHFLPDNAVVEFLIGALGSIAGAATAFAVMKERVRMLTEGQRDLWREIEKLRDADHNHVERFHAR
jgi:hypothetical protein